MVYFGVAGCTLWHILVGILLGPSLLRILPSINWSVLVVPILMVCFTSDIFPRHSLEELSGSVVPQYLYVWTDGNLVPDGLADTGYALCGVFADLLPEMMLRIERCSLYFSA